MQSDIRFSVYEHTLVIKDDQLITRKFIVLRDSQKRIAAWTDFHRYIRSGKRKYAHNISDDGNMRFYYVCMLLNYAFFERYHIQRLTDITVKVVSDFLNDYGMGVLPGDSRGRTEATVNTCIRTIIDFLEELADRNPGTCRIKKSELYKNVKVYNKQMRRLDTRKVPVFDVHYLTEPKEIFRDMPERVFSILMNVIIKKHRELLMLTALSAFAGLRPSESCNVRRQDSRLGAGIRFVILDGELSDISIDLTRERK